MKENSDEGINLPKSLEELKDILNNPSESNLKIRLIPNIKDYYDNANRCTKGNLLEILGKIGDETTLDFIIENIKEDIDYEHKFNNEGIVIDKNKV